jgi:hypothetical protein
MEPVQINTKWTQPNPSIHELQGIVEGKKVDKLQKNYRLARLVNSEDKHMELCLAEDMLP